MEQAAIVERPDKRQCRTCGGVYTLNRRYFRAIGKGYYFRNQCRECEREYKKWCRYAKKKRLLYTPPKNPERIPVETLEKKYTRIFETLHKLGVNPIFAKAKKVDMVLSQNRVDKEIII